MLVIVLLIFGVIFIFLFLILIFCYFFIFLFSNFLNLIYLSFL